jgi:hypothetical protein
MELVDWADAIQQEIDSDPEGSWYWPGDPTHNIFDQAWMRFVNRNLNYFCFPNMVTLAANREQQFNPKLKVALEFCNYARKFNNNLGPYGRMCVWRLPPGKQLLAHVDNFEYHAHIIRNIFVISDNNQELFKININSREIECPKGTFFQFSPYSELHEFLNNTEHDFYFLGFDYWDLNKLSDAVARIGVNNLIIHKSQRQGFGASNTKKLYMSEH